MSKHKIDIFDKGDAEGFVTTEVAIEHSCVYIMPKGYGDFSSQDGDGCTVMIERYNGKLRVVIWGDINQEDPTNIIPLEGALESKRI